jgi:hypothetical protein
MTNLNEPLRLAICVAGVYLFYLWYGICQEELYVSHTNAYRPIDCGVDYLGAGGQKTIFCLLGR